MNPSPQPLAVSIVPQPVYIETGTAGQYLNFDLLLTSQSEAPLVLTGIQVSVFDRTGALVLRKLIDEGGGIYTLPNRQLNFQQPLLVFNPFFFFEPHIDLHTLRYEFFTQPASLVVPVDVRPQAYETRTPLRLPVQQRALIWDGHDFYSHHRRYNYWHPHHRPPHSPANFQRYGYDFVPVDDQGRMCLGPEDRNESWLGFGVPVCAPAPGHIADCFDGMPDDRTFDQTQLTTRPMVYGGNYIVIDHHNGEYSYVGHLQQGSVQVQVGAAVTAGQVLGRIGASGSSLFPHLHYELRTGLGVAGVEGLPSYFHHFRRRLGAHSLAVARGPIDSGDIVEPL